MTKLENIHPGEILLEEFLIPMNISQNKLADIKPLQGVTVLSNGVVYTTYSFVDA